MSRRKGAVSERDFVKLVKKHGLKGTAEVLGYNRRTVQRYRNTLEERYNIPIAAPGNRSQRPIKVDYPWRAPLQIKDGVVLICGDAHYWPGQASLMHRALVAFCKEYKPKAVIHIGDVVDAPTISRHPPIGWEGQPELADEIEVCKERLWEIEQAAGRAEKIWCLGNHDARFETRLATVAPQYARINGVHLRDHYPAWKACWSAWINNGELVAKHRFSGGEYAPKNNALRSGKSMATGHLHSAKVIPVTDYNGTRYGVDVGCIADVDHKAFIDYSEDNPRDWRSAFGFFTFKNGRLLYPELVLKWDKYSVEFRGEIIRP